MYLAIDESPAFKPFKARNVQWVIPENIHTIHIPRVASWNSEGGGGGGFFDWNSEDVGGGGNAVWNSEGIGGGGV